MKRLYRVEKVWYVLAHDEMEADHRARELDCEPTVSVEVANSVESDWWDAIPAGEEGDRTCSAIMAAQAGGR